MRRRRSGTPTWPGFASLVETANARGENVLVVTNLIGTRTIQAKLRKDLAGLDYKFNKKGLVAHSNFMKWMGEAIREQLERNAAVEMPAEAVAGNR